MPVSYICILGSFKQSCVGSQFLGKIFNQSRRPKSALGLFLFSTRCHMHVEENICILRGEEEVSAHQTPLGGFSGASNNLAGLVCPWYLQKGWWVSLDVWGIILGPTSPSGHSPLISKALPFETPLFQLQVVYSFSWVSPYHRANTQGDLWTQAAENLPHISP